MAPSISSARTFTESITLPRKSMDSHNRKHTELRGHKGRSLAKILEVIGYRVGCWPYITTVALLEDPAVQARINSNGKAIRHGRSHE